MNKKFTFIPIFITYSFLIISHASLSQSTIRPRSEMAIMDTAVTSKFKVSIGGQMRLNGIYDFNALQNSEAFNITNIPTGNADDSPRFSLGVRQSRISLDAAYYSDILGKVYTFFEGDFLGSGAFGFRLRHFFVDVKGFKVGQYWSTFNDMDVWPDIIDFDGPPTGAWARSAQIRYTKPIENFGKLALAFESPRASITSIPVVDSTLTSTYQGVPDFVSQLYWKRNKMHLSLSMVLRRLHYLSNNKKLANNAGGFSFSGHFDVGKMDQFIFQVTGGSGIASYLVSFEGGGYDAVSKGNGELSNIRSIGGYCAYEHWWLKYLKSTMVYGYMHLNHGIDYTVDNTFTGHYLSGNIFYLLDENITLGLEGQYGNVDNFNSETGEASRIQFMFLLDF